MNYFDPRCRRRILKYNGSCNPCTFPCCYNGRLWKPWCTRQGLSIVAWVVLSDRYRVHTRPDEECDRLAHAYQLDGVDRGYIGGMLLEKFYNRGWVDYVLLVLTPHRAARLDAATREPLIYQALQAGL